MGMIPSRCNLEPHCTTYHFYHATLCISAVFAVAGVCLSITLVYCIQMAKDIPYLLSRPGSPIILVF